MTTGTRTPLGAEERAQAPRRFMRWQTLAFYLGALLLLAIGLYLRLHDLGLPFDRDSYDEGVYWQTLRAMSAGHMLYRQTFYSQPPFFMLALFPFYILFEQTLVAARLGIVILSLLGLAGTFLLGKVLSGRLGALAALLLLVANALYLAESQTLQAEAPYVAFSLLAVAFAFLWWEHPEGVKGTMYAIGAAVTLVLSIFCKLFVAELVPLVVLIALHLWRSYRGSSAARDSSSHNLRLLVVGVIALLVTTLLVLLPFSGALVPLWQGMVSFHTAADVVYKNVPQPHFSLIWPVLASLLGLAALYGSVVALLRRDWRIVSLLLWLLVTLFQLWLQKPLFSHHLVVLVPPLIALAVMGIGRYKWEGKSLMSMRSALTAIALLLILIAAGAGVLASRQYLRDKHAQGSAPATLSALRVAGDLEQLVQPGQEVITDAQFLTGLANRNTPPWLVDTSTVRIDTGYLTAGQLIQQAQRPQVRAVLFYTGRLNIKQLAQFHTWVAQHFRLVHRYGNGKELWIRR